MDFQWRSERHPVMLAVQILEDQRALPLGCADLQQLCFPFARTRVGLSDAIAVPSLQSHCCPGIASAIGGCTPCRASRQSDKPEPHDSHLVCLGFGLCPWEVPRSMHL